MRPLTLQCARAQLAKKRPTSRKHFRKLDGTNKDKRSIAEEMWKNERDRPLIRPFVDNNREDMIGGEGEGHIHVLRV